MYKIHKRWLYCSAQKFTGPKEVKLIVSCLEQVGF